MKGSAQQLKSLQGQKRQLQQKLERLAAARRETIGQISGINEKIEKLQANSPEPIVSEHALLRFLEQVEGIDLDQLRERILTADVRQAMMTLGPSGKYPSGAGYRVVMRDNTVTTIEV